MYQLHSEELDILAKERAANWRQFESFGWHGRPEWAEQAYIWNIQHRDSNVITRANAKAITKEFEEKFPDSENWRIESHGHWGVGWIECIVIRVYDDNNNRTPEFDLAIEIQEALSQYPVYDEDLWSQMEYDEAYELVERECARFVNDDPEFDVWPGEVLSRLLDNGHCTGDEFWPDEQDVKEFLFERGWLEEEYLEDIERE